MDDNFISEIKNTWQNKLDMWIYFKKLFFISLIFILGGCDFMTVNYNYHVEVGHPIEYQAIFDWNNSYLYDTYKQPLLDFGGEIGSGSDWGNGTQITSLFYEGPIPSGIKVRWFSVMEDQFWEGEYKFNFSQLTALHHDKVWKTLYQEFSDPMKNGVSYTVYVVPGGLVTIWMNTSANKILLGQFQAKKIDIPWEDFASSLLIEMNRENFIQMHLTSINTPEYVRQEAKNNKLPSFVRWKRLMKTYSWKLKGSSNFILKDYFTRYVNGEQYYTYQGDLQQSERAVPHFFYVYLEDKFGKITRLGITLDKEEIIAAFEKLNSKYSMNTEFTILIDETDDLQYTRIYLIVGEDKVSINADCSLEDLYIGRANKG